MYIMTRMRFLVVRESFKVLKKKIHCVNVMNFFGNGISGASDQVYCKLLKGKRSSENSVLKFPS